MSKQQIYRENAQKSGGWEGFKTFQVLRKEPESTNITSFYLSPGDGASLPAFKPGQYTTVRIAGADGQTTMRNYSLSDRPGHPYFRISVKREPGPSGSPDGYVSNWLHDHLQVGMQVELAPPCGEFFLDVSEKHTRPLVLLGAGVGITPIMSILAAALQAMPGRPVVVIHGCLNEGVQAFRTQLEELAEKHSNLKVHFRYSDPPQASERRGNASTGFVDAALIESLLPDRDADYYFCGPQPFMVGIYRQLLRWGLPPAQVRFEFFGPRQALS